MKKMCNWVPIYRNFTVYFRLLLALACIDCLFIVPGILIYVFEAFKLHANWYNYIFPTFLQPCAEIALCSSIYMTVAIAVERFIGLCRPFRRLSSRPCPAKAYILPVLGISVLVNIPKFLESETFKYTDQMCNQTTEICYNITRTVVSVTTLRTDPNYITYYTMWTRLLITGIFPLAMLAILNTKIYLALRKSKAQLRSLAIRAALPMAILGKPATPPSQMDLRIDSTNNWTTTTNGSGPPPHGNHVNNGGIGMTTPLNQQTPPPPAKSPKPHPMNRSVSAAVVESRNLLQPLTRSHSTSAAGTPVRATNGHAVQTNGGSTTQTASGSGAGANTDLTLAPILFGVVIVFVICHTLRVFLNIYDFSVADEIISCEMKGVGRWPAPWFICLTYVNQLMIMINSSVNFLVYCVAGSKFRTILYQQLSSVFKQLRRQRPPERLHVQHQQGPRNNLLPNSRNLSSRLPNFNNGHNHHHHETALLQPSYSNTRNGGRLITSAGPRGHLHQFHQHPRILELNENQV